MRPEQGLAGRAAALESTRAARTALESELASARASQATLSAALRSREHDLAGLTARLASLEELEAARADFSDAARVVLAEANGHVQQHGAVADWLEVDRRYERAVEALTGDFAAARDRADARARRGRTSAAPRTRGRPLRVPRRRRRRALARPADRRRGAPVAFVRGARQRPVRIGCRRRSAARLHRRVVRRGRRGARATGERVATLDGDLVHGGHLVVGGGRRDARGILATKGEIKSCAHVSRPSAST
jgi:chromosome segregation ATPase